MHMLFVMHIVFHVCGIVFTWSYIYHLHLMNNEYVYQYIHTTLFSFLDLIYPAINIQPGEEQKR